MLKNLMVIEKLANAELAPFGLKLRLKTEIISQRKERKIYEGHNSEVEYYDEQRHVIKVRRYGQKETTFTVDFESDQKIIDKHFVQPENGKSILIHKHNVAEIMAIKDFIVFKTLKLSV